MDISLSELDNSSLPKLKDMSFNNLVMSSGGMNGIIMIGALNYLYSINKIQSINNYFGSSAGAFISLMLCIGYTPFEINQEILDIDNANDFMHIDLQNLVKNLGVFCHSKIKKVIEKMVNNKLGFIPTLKELYELTDKNITFCVFNYTNLTTEYIDHTTHPKDLCTDVCTASCCIPVLFTPVKLNNDFKYIDGGLSDPFPIGQCVKKFQGNTLGIVLNKVESGEDSSILKYLLGIVFANTIYKKHKSAMKYMDRKDCCVIGLSHENKGIDFNMDMTDKLKLFLSGDLQVRKKCKLLFNKSQNSK